MCQVFRAIARPGDMHHLLQCPNFPNGARCWCFLKAIFTPIHTLPQNNSFIPTVHFYFPHFFLWDQKGKTGQLGPQPVLPLEIKEIRERKTEELKKKVKKTPKENQHSSKLKRWMFKALRESPFSKGPVPSEARGIIPLKIHRISFTSSKLESDEPRPSLNKWM